MPSPMLAIAEGVLRGTLANRERREQREQRRTSAAPELDCSQQ